MEIGAKLRNLRQRLGLTQEELGARCDLTKGYISQLENDLASPSISTLEDLLTVLGCTLGEFFQKPAEQNIIYTKEDYFTADTARGLTTWLVTDSQKRQMEPIIVEIAPETEVEPDPPFEGEMFGYVLQGAVEVRFGQDSYSLKKGEAFYFHADREHAICNTKKYAAKVLWVSTPPNF